MTETTFIEREASIQRALARVKAKLLQFEALANSCAKQCTKEQEDALRPWNNWLDLYDRLHDRLQANWSDYKDWHWYTYGFNTYDI